MNRWQHPTDYSPRIVANDTRRRTFRDDIADFIADVRAHPWLCATVFGLGLAAGMLGVLGLAEIIVRVAF